MRRGFTLCVVIVILSPAIAWAQSVDGYVSFLGDLFPRVVYIDGHARAVAELRTRLFAEHSRELGDHFKLTTAGFLDLLAARRHPGDRTTAAIVRPQELHLEASWANADLRVGYTRVVWGRLDEFQPTDVVNPQDLGRFFFEGRTEGRMAVPMVRGRWLPSDRFTVEGIYVPVFRRGRFDQLDEESSPFNLAPRPSNEVKFGLDSAQGGGRVSGTSGRVDWAMSAYRGIEPLPTYDARLVGGEVKFEERFPRFTMIGGDFETVRGEWGFRGEVAAFIEGEGVEGGLGIDRKAGDYRVSGSVVVTAKNNRTDTTLVGGLDRSFARETRRLRAFAVYNPGEATAFTRLIGAISLRDDVWLEGSAGWFVGRARPERGREAAESNGLGRFETRDFLYARLKVFF